MKRTIALTIVIAGAVVGLVIAWMTVRQDQKFRRLIAEGDNALRHDQSFVAIEAFSGALALQPNSMLAHVKRGDAYRRRGEMDAAFRDLRTAAALDPSATRPREMLGDASLAIGKPDQAIDDYRAFIALDDRQSRVLYKLALAYYRSGRPAQAIDPLRQSIAIDGRLVEAHYLLGLCQESSSLDDAKRSLTRAIGIQPAFGAAREELARLHMAAGDFPDAVKQLEALASLEPAHVERAIAVGLALAKGGRTESAIVRLGRIAEQHPDEPSVYTALGRLWLEMAEARHDTVALNKSLEALETATNASSPTSESLTLYGRALLLSGDLHGAEHALDSASTQFPVDPRAFLYLSRVEARLGHADRARAALANYSALSPEGVSAAQSSPDPRRPAVRPRGN